MIENPKNLTEQLLNLVERIATEIKAIYNKVNKAVFKINGKEPDTEGNIDIDTSGIHVGTSAPTGDEVAWIDPSVEEETTLDLGSITDGKELILRRGTTAEVSSFTGVNGELVVDTQAKSVHLQDGSTAGGIKLAKASDVTSLQSSINTTISGIEDSIEDLNTNVDNIDVGVKLVNNQAPDASGNVNVDVTLTKDKVTSALGYTPLETAPVTSVNGMTGAVTGLVKSVNGTVADGNGNVTITTSSGTMSQVFYESISMSNNSYTTRAITGLVANKPVVIAMDHVCTMTEFTSNIYLCPISGTSVNAVGTPPSNNGWFIHSYYNNELKHGCGGTCVLIPTGTSITLRLNNGGQTSNVNLYVYQ